jgi:CspA family cold shock protein
MKQKILVRSLFVSVGVSALAPLAVYPVLAVEPIQWLAYLLLFLIFLAATVLVSWASGAWDGVFEHDYAPRTSLGVQSSDEVGLQEMGTVKWFDAGKGYGFILRDSGAEIFVHYRSLLGEGHRSLFEGQRVAFVIAQGRKGLQAEEVMPIEA